MEQKEIQKQLDDLKTNVIDVATEKGKEAVDKAIKDVEKAIESKNKELIEKTIKEHASTLNAEITKLNDWQKVKDERDEQNQKAIDESLSTLKEIQKNTKPRERKGFMQTFAEEIAKPEHVEGIKSVTKGKSYVMQLKTAAGDLSLSNLTGDSQISYDQRQAILPSQRVNIRDYLPTVHSDTGVFVHYKETGGNGSVGEQTEGSSKSQIDYTFSEVQTVNKYVAGFARFSKQMMRSLPWLQTTLPRLLMRDFFQEENSYFKSRIAAAATAATTTSETDDVKQLMDWIALQNDADFTASMVFVKWATLCGINKLLYTNGYYQGSGGNLSQPDGSLRISGVPIIPVSWMNASKALIIDTDYVERIEVEGIKVEFFEQDGTNVTKNQITARIECYEEVNPMLGNAFLYGQL